MAPITSTSPRSARIWRRGSRPWSRPPNGCCKRSAADPDAAMGASVKLHDADRIRLWRLADGARRARGQGGPLPGGDEDFCRAKIATARFYAEQILPKASALLTAVRGGAIARVGIAGRGFLTRQKGGTGHAARIDGIRRADRRRRTRRPRGGDPAETDFARRSPSASSKKARKLAPISCPSR